GIECHGRRIGAGVAAYELSTRTTRPQPQLIDGAGSKGVCGAQEHGFALLAQSSRKLSDERGFSGTVHAEYEHHGRPFVGEAEGGITVSRPQRLLDATLKRCEELRLRLHLPALSAPLHVTHEPHRGWNSEVRLQQKLFQLLERTGIHAAAREHGDVHHCNVFYAVPERPCGRITLSAE